MTDSDHTESASAGELARLRQRVAELEASEERLKLAEEETVRQGAVLSAINEIFRGVLTSATEEDLGKTCLAVAERLTGSKFGFLGEINGKGLFDTVAVSNPGWGVCEMAVLDAKKHIESMPIRGIDRATMRDGQSRIVNEDEMATHPDGCGTPEGHPSVTAFLGVPLKHEGKTVGMIGLGNKESGYDAADQEAVEGLSVAIVEALRHARAAGMLEERTAQLRRTVNMMAGREVRMAELKKAIDQLCAQLEAAGLTPVAGDPLREGTGVATEVKADRP